jgi:Zn-dependent protease
MKWSFRIARISGIDIRVHATFALVIVLGSMEFAKVGGTSGALFGALFVCAVFACVTLHELGHGLVAQGFGVQVREIVLLPIGGMARLSREPSKPMHELVIAIAGPLVNVAIAALIGGTVLVTLGSARALFELPMPVLSPRALLVWLFLTNLLLAVLNMIPVLPMDGGRVLRALLSMLVGKNRATQIAAILSQMIAAGFVAGGIMKTQPVLLLVGLFVFFAATMERLNTRASLAIALRAWEVVDPYAIVLAPSQLLGGILEKLSKTPQRYFAVVDQNRLVGTLSRDEAIAGAQRAGLEASIAGVMRQDVVEVDAEAPLDEVREILVLSDGRPVGVKSAAGFVGLLGVEDVARFLSSASGLASRSSLPPPAPSTR